MFNEFPHRAHGGDRCRFARGEHGKHGAGQRHRGRHGRGGGGRSGLGRFFAHGDLRLVVLHLIAEAPRHGYDIIKQIEARVAGAYSPSPGVIYPTLSLLEDQGFVTVANDPDGGKKLYTVTPQGSAFLEANAPALDALLARMDAIGKGSASDAGDRIIVAMDRLKAALRQQLAAPDPDPETVAAIIAAIETAAETVEALS